MTKLHLGCGTRYLDGYVNIDHPVGEHTVQHDLVADRYADITKLTCPHGSIDEIRLHHVFEHFSRPVALAQLCRWTDWLRPDGVLRIETPDALGCAWALVKPWTSEASRQQIVRHLFGSHEAAWAVHWDGWYEERFRRTLAALGFRKLRFRHSRWGALRNVEVSAIRGSGMLGLSDYERIVDELLKLSLVSHASMRSMNDIAASERVMHGVWMRDWKRAYLCESTPDLGDNR